MKKKNVKTLLWLACFFVLPAPFILSQQKLSIQLGAEQIGEITDLLKDKRVGLIVNQTSILETAQVHLLDTLLACGVSVRKVFAPEHGFRGTEEAGESIHDSRDLKTGIPIISLYGKNKKPTADQLTDIDVVVFDIQDVGVRFYTYISTMHYAMEACAENDKDFVVLDRPNPNDYVDGPVRKKGFESFVGLDPVPVLHGLTVGELAQMINGERWLKAKPDTCRLYVVRLKHWKHGDPYWLPVRPSPNLPNDQAIRLYPSLGWFEGTSISIGRGTYFPFQVIGYPDPSYGSFSFTPHAIDGLDSQPLHKGKSCFGVDLREYPFEGGLTLRYLLRFYELSGRKASFFARPDWFDLLAGSKDLRRQISAGLTEEEIRILWHDDLSEYKAMRSKYLLYADYPQPGE